MHNLEDEIQRLVIENCRLLEENRKLIEENRRLKRLPLEKIAEFGRFSLELLHLWLTRSNSRLH
jgi:hypothetical protein